MLIKNYKNTIYYNKKIAFISLNIPWGTSSQNPFKWNAWSLSGSSMIASV